MLNHPVVRQKLDEAAAKVLGAENVLLKVQGMGGEDFSFYCERVPSAIFWLGCRPADRENIPLHNPLFSPDEEIMPLGMEVLVRSALRFLK